MISFSIRDYLQAAGQTVSLRQLAQESGQPFPLLVRNWVGALPPGRVLRKEIPLDLLRHKFDEFFNDRDTPLFKIRLHGEEYGKSELTIYLDEPAVGYQKFGEPLDMGHLEIDLPLAPNPDYRFNNLESNRISMNVTQAEPLVIEARLDFETQNEELKVNNFPNIDFTELNIRLKVELLLNDDGAIDPLKWVDEASDPTEYINTRVLVVAPALDDDLVRNRVRSKINEKLFEKLKALKEEARDKLKRMATTWLVGGDFYVRDVSSNGQSLFIEFVLPPGHLEPFPEVPQTPLDPGRLANIEHIVVLMMENRSFDHMLGYLSKHGGRQDIDGLRGGEKNPYHGQDYFSFPLPSTVFDPGPCHEYDCVDAQTKGGTMGGFVEDYAPRAKEAGISPGEVMGYHTAGHVPVYDALAKEFLICQRWFAAHPGPTFPNRFYTLTGRLNRDVYGRWEKSNPEHEFFVPTWEKNIFDHLSAQGVSWRYFEDGYCFLRLFARYTTDNNNIVNYKDLDRGFVASAIAGTLPAVTFIDPNFINVSDGHDGQPDGNDDQPPADIAHGQHLIGEVVNAVINSPLWGKTLLVITYDEHGGFYDHVSPPPAPAVSGVDVYGVRVPAFVVSPWVDRGKVSNEVFDHTSILKTIIRRFLSKHPADMGERVANAKDLSLVLQPTSRSDKPTITVPPAPLINMAHATHSEQPTEGKRDFNTLLRTVRARYPVS